MCSGDAVLHDVLAREAATIAHTIKSPPIVGSLAPLCYFVAIVAQSGVGKSTANAVGGELMPGEELPPGSGEGLVDSLFETVAVPGEDGRAVKTKQQTRFNAFVYLDEGEALAVLGARMGSTLLPTLRSIWTGQVIGSTNASAERKRIVPAGQYAIGLVVGIQESMVGPLLQDANAGTPQRFAWVSAIDPSVPDRAVRWPGALDWQPPSAIELEPFETREYAPYVRHVMQVADTVRNEVWSNKLAKTRGEVVTDPLHAHADLLRLKMAGLLALLDRRMDVTEEDWFLAGIMRDASDRVLEHAQAVVASEAIRTERQTSTKMARRQVVAADALDERRIKRIERATELIRDKVAQRPGRTRKQVRSALSHVPSDEFNAAFHLAIEREWIYERPEPGQGSEKKRCLYPDKA